MTSTAFPAWDNFCLTLGWCGASMNRPGKKTGTSNKKMGNAHLKWAFGEAVCLLMRQCPKAKAFVERKAKKHGKGKAMGILSAKLGRAVYYMLKRKEPFNVNRFLN